MTTIAKLAELSKYGTVRLTITPRPESTAAEIMVRFIPQCGGEHGSVTRVDMFGGWSEKLMILELERAISEVLKVITDMPGEVSDDRLP